MDLTWAAEQLNRFLELARQPASSEPTQELRGQELIVHKIADVVWPDWRSWEFPYYAKWGGTFDLAQRCLMLVERQEEIEQNLGDVGPKLTAAALHPWVWEAARSLWSSGHYAQAVTAAVSALTASCRRR